MRNIATTAMMATEPDIRLQRPATTVAAITSWKLRPSIVCPRMMLRMIRNGAAKARIGTVMKVEGLGPLSSTRKLKALGID